MVKTLIIKSARKILQNKLELENNLKIKLFIKGRNLTLSGNNEIDEYFASRVLQAFDYRFLIEDALLLKSEEYDFKIINIKSHTNRKNLGVIRGRIIGTKGKTLKVLGDLTGCEFAVKDNEVVIIGLSERIHEAEKAIISLIKGRKQGNVYANLERINRIKRKRGDY
mgnify:FL=1